MFRQELSETKSKILETLGASESSDSEREEPHPNFVPDLQEKSLVSENFSKKKEVKMVYVSPESSKDGQAQKEDSMALSSSSSKKLAHDNGPVLSRDLQKPK